MKRGFIFGLAFGALLLYFFTSSDVYAANFESSMYGYHVKGVQDGKKLDQRVIFVNEDISPVSYRIQGKSSVTPFNGSTYVWRGMSYRNFYNSETDNFAMYSYAYLFDNGPVLDSSENYEYSFNLVQNTSTSSSVVMPNFGNLKVFYRYSIDTVDYSYICTVGNASDRWSATRKISCVIPGTVNTSQYEIFFDFEDSLVESSSIVDFVVSEKPSYSVTDLLPNLEPTPTPTPPNPNQGVEDAIGKLEGTIMDDTPPDTGSLGNSAGWLPPGPVDSLINLPLTMLQNLSNALGTTCKPLTLTLPFVDEDIQLPCLVSVYNKMGELPIWLNTIGTIASGFILFGYFLNLYDWVENRIKMKDNAKAKDWGGS